MSGELFDNDAARDHDRGVISDLKPLESDPNLRRVKVAGRTVATLRAADTESLGLEIGQRWTKSLADRVAETVQANKARRDAMRLLSGRGFSRQELHERLLKRSYAEAVIRRIVAEAQHDGWLNERAFAEDIVRSVTQKRSAGRRLLEEKLRQHRVDEDVARQVSEDAGREQNDRQAAMALAQRQLATMGGVELATAARRIAGLLARRGFEEDVVAAAIQSLRLNERKDAADEAGDV